MSVLKINNGTTWESIPVIKGEDGHTPVITASKSGTDTTIFVDGTAIATISDGADGQDGKDGADGADGHSPVVTASKSGKTTTVSVDGEPIASILDGNDGQDGQDGADGHTPVKGTDYWTAADKAEIVEDVLDEVDMSSAFVKKAASGAIVSFSDGADGVPVEDLTVEIAPIQDLHGYDNPWPGGGGKQLFNMVPENVNDGQNYTMTGTEGNYTLTSTGGYGRVSFLVTGLTIGEKYTFNAYFKKPTAASGYNSVLYFFSENSWNYDYGVISLGSQAFTTEEHKSLTFTATTETLFIGFYITAAGAYGDVITVRGAMLSKGETQETFAPYSNICPITGWTGANVCRTGKNVIDGATLVHHATSIKNGKIGVDSYDDTTPNGSIKLTAGKYTFSVSGANSTNWEGLYLRKEDGTTTALSYNNKSVTFTVQADGFYYFALNIRSEDFVSWDNYDIQLERGETQTAYQEFGDVIPIDWTTEAGTVYGGTLDVTTGVLTVTDANIASYNGETLPGEWISDRDVYAVGTTPTTGAQVVYKLAAPQTYQLTAQEVTTLLGDNVIWADCGDSAIEYCADTKTYVDESIPDLTDYVKNTDYAQTSTPGVARGAGGYGTTVINDSVSHGVIGVEKANDTDIKGASHNYRPIVPTQQHKSVFYGLAKAAGDTTQAASSNAVGTYTDTAKTKIKEMLGVEKVVSVSGATPTITAEANARYICGTVTSLSFTPCATGICDVRFTSGSTVAVLTIPSTVKLPEWFDATSLETNTVYEINVIDGVYGVVMTWAA